MEDFRDYLISIDDSFPVAEADFNTKLKTYSETSEGAQHAIKYYIGFQGDTLRIAMINCISIGQIFSKYEELNPIYESWVSLTSEVNDASPSGMQGATMSGGFEFAWLETQ